MEKHLRTLANFAAQEAAKLEKQRKKIMDAKSKIREYDSTAIVNDDCMVVVHSVTGYTGETVQILKTVKEDIKDMKKKEKVMCYMEFKLMKEFHYEDTFGKDEKIQKQYKKYLQQKQEVNNGKSK